MPNWFCLPFVDLCQENHKMCEENDLCIKQSEFCDGVANCPLATDERDCPETGLYFFPKSDAKSFFFFQMNVLSLISSCP